MRDPDQLPSLLYSLLDLPSLSQLLQQPAALVNYLQREAWPDTEIKEDPRWSIYPDTEESEEAAEILPLVEQRLSSLSTAQQETLSWALETVCPECLPTLQILMPRRSPARP